MARTAAALAKHEDLPLDVAAEGLTATELSPHRFIETTVLGESK
jgi:UDP-N-acetylmuramyl pentapeptide synthase